MRRRTYQGHEYFRARVPLTIAGDRPEGVSQSARFYLPFFGRFLAAVLHDIGEIRVNKSVLTSTGKLAAGTTGS